MFCTVGWCTWQNVFASLLLFKYKNVCNNFKNIKTKYRNMGGTVPKLLALLQQVCLNLLLKCVEDHSGFFPVSREMAVS